MKCLIVAAGRGSRLSSNGVPKPLVELLGLPLIERVILTAKKGGASEFFVVTGYKGKKVREFLYSLSERRKIKITTITNGEWEKENGISVLKAKKFINEKFIMLMTDHIFDPMILQKLKKQKIKEDEVILAVDYNIKNNKLVDPEDATKVLVENGYILNIGKNIYTYNAYDTGIFLCTPAIFEAIEESVRNGDSSISGGMRILASKGKARAFDIGNTYWIDVDTEDGLKKAEKLVLNTFKKKPPMDQYQDTSIDQFQPEFPDCLLRPE